MGAEQRSVGPPLLTDAAIPAIQSVHASPSVSFRPTSSLR